MFRVSHVTASVSVFSGSEMAARTVIFLALVAVSSCLDMPTGEPIPAIQGLVSRILGEKFVSLFEYEVIPSADDKDVFELDTNVAEKKPVLRGNNGVALASALNFYLKYNCNCSISWGRNGTGDQLNVPLPLPLPPLTKMVSPVKYRYYQNVCTVSYSMVWWDFARWEREIDWMAMNGLNLILSFTGQEYVWQKFYRSLGMNDTAIKEFFSGPAFLAWQRMGNIQGWAGPLDDGWIQSQADIQKQIVSRVREFGMVNVLPGFAGHVPAALKDLYPNATYTQNEGWGNFNSTYSSDYLLQPNNTLFIELGQIFYKMLIEEYGSDHVFNCDTYNEMNPRSSNLTYLAAVNKAIYETMRLVDEDAVFLMQGWLFHSGFWTNDRIKAFLSEVPDDRMIILDLNSEESPIWSRTDSYFGKPFIWCLLHNYGGTRGIYGNLTTIGTSPVQSLNTPGSTMAGVGMTPEAIEHNPVVYDLMGEMSWRSEEVKDIPSWTMQYAARRYGNSNLPPTVQQAWLYLLNGAYQYHWSWNIKSMVDRHPEFSLPYYSSLHAAEIALAWQLITNAAHGKELNPSIGPLRYDIVDFGRQTLVDLFADVQRMYTSAYNRFVQTGDTNMTVELYALTPVMLDIIDDVEILLASDTNFLLGHWIADARASVPSSSPPSAVNNAEFNARNQVTMWGARENIEDYATKEWAGLFKDYYKPRWTLFTSYVNEAVKEGRELDQIVYELESFHLESKFSYTIKSYPTTPIGDTIEIAYNLSQKYLPTMDYVLAHYDVFKDKDAPGNDIIFAWNNLVIQLAWLCDINPSCAAFNDNGYLKTSAKETQVSIGTVLYVKKAS